MNNTVSSIKTTSSKYKLISFNNKEEWRAWCDQNITPEDSAALMGENPWESPEDLLTRKTSVVSSQKPITEAMIKGKEHRPLALEAYKQENPSFKLSSANIQSTSMPCLIAHVDLFDTRASHIVEVRCGDAAYDKAVGKAFPPKPYWAEAQHILAITGLKYITLYFHNANEEKKPFSIKVWRKDEYISRLGNECKTFITQMTEIKKIKEIEKQSHEIQKAKEALEMEKEMARKVYSAVIGKSPKVDKETFQRYVPSHFDRKGRLTPLGQSLLLKTS